MISVRCLIRPPSLYKLFHATEKELNLKSDCIEKRAEPGARAVLFPGFIFHMVLLLPSYNVFSSFPKVRTTGQEAVCLCFSMANSGSGCPSS